MRRLIIRSLTLTAALLIGGLSPLSAQGTAFSYYGRLNDDALPANGNYDFGFALYDAEAGGNIVGPPAAREAVAVTAGQFAVQLDYGPDAFTGAPRWLEISVRKQGVGEPLLLAPRQAMLPTPYAVYAESAGAVPAGAVGAGQLNVPGPAPAAGQVLAYDGAGLFWTTAPGGADSVFSLNGTSAYYLGGNVGMGTATPAAKLHLLDPAASLTQLIETGGGVNAWAKVAFRNANGQWDMGTSRGYNNDVFYLDRLGNSALELQLSTTGNLGLGIEPQAKLHLFQPDSSVSQRIQSGGDVNAWSRVEFVNGNGQWNVGTSRGYNGDQLYFHRQGSPSIAFGVQPNGDAFLQGRMSCKVLTITGGADIAEPFELTGGKAPEGSVVVIDPLHPGKLKCSTGAYDKRVAGIVSGANGVTPGLSLHQTGLLDGGQHVALSGRVYVLADASTVPIEPGDLLTTSDTAGHAMKAVDCARAQGAILGKAMDSLREGTGVVLVLVTLQ